MFKDEFRAAAEAAFSKSQLLKKNPLGYFVLSVLAGFQIGFGVLLSFTAGGLLTGVPGAKLVMGAFFAVALSLVVMAGGELFTGNNMVMAAGVLKKKVSLKDAVSLWAICWMGNVLGGILLAFLYHATGLWEGPVGEFMAAAALGKMTAAPLALVTRGILCNMLVCLAVWCGFRCRTETAKLIMIFWCILAFFASGFEHSVANMTLLSFCLMEPFGQALTIGGWFYNLLLVTLGNMIGGICLVALPYFAAAEEK